MTLEEQQVAERKAAMAYLDSLLEWQKEATQVINKLEKNVDRLNTIIADIAIGSVIDDEIPRSEVLN
jgi:uncharacterized protein YukE